MFTLRFDMTSQEGREEFRHAQQGRKYHAVLWEMDQWLRQQYKYNNKVWAGEARSHLWDLLNDRHINLLDE